MPRWAVGAEGFANLGGAGDADFAFLRAGTNVTAWTGVVFDAAVACGVDGPVPDVLLTIGATIDLF